MVKCGAFPLRGCVANRAIGGEPGGFVIRIRRRVVCRKMAGTALLRRAGILAIDVALLASCGDVLAGEREFCPRMVELCALPLSGGVACLAGRREASCLVVGVSC